MAIIDLQRRIAEAGRIRIGRQVATSSGKTRPAKLDTFRLTSHDKRRIDEAARLFGGIVKPWKSPAGNAFEVITETDALSVLVPPTDMAFSQHYELWSAAGCQRRCDGQNEIISQGPCLCDAEARECSVHSRLSVLLADMRGLGLWRLDTQGWNAAHELSGSVEIIRVAAARGELLPATLRLEQRVSRKVDQGTRRYAVPVLDINITPAELLGEMRSDSAVLAIKAYDETDGYSDDELVRAPVVIDEPAADEPQRPSSVREQFAPKQRPASRGQLPVKPTHVQIRKRGTIVSAETPERDPVERALETITEVAATVAKLTETQQQSRPLSAEQNALLHQLFEDCGISNHDERRIIASHILKGDIDTKKQAIQAGQASTLIDTLQKWLRDNDDQELANRVLTILNEHALREAGQTDLLDELDSDDT